MKNLRWPVGRIHCGVLLGVPRRNACQLLRLRAAANDTEYRHRNAASYDHRPVLFFPQCGPFSASTRTGAPRTNGSFRNTAALEASRKPVMLIASPLQNTVDDYSTGPPAFLKPELSPFLLMPDIRAPMAQRSPTLPKRRETLEFFRKAVMVM